MKKKPVYKNIYYYIKALFTYNSKDYLLWAELPESS